MILSFGALLHQIIAHHLGHVDVSLELVEVDSVIDVEHEAAYGLKTVHVTIAVDVNVHAVVIADRRGRLGGSGRSGTARAAWVPVYESWSGSTF